MLKLFFLRRSGPVGALAAVVFSLGLGACANRAEQYRVEDEQQRAEIAKRRAGSTRLATLAEVTPRLGCTPAGSPRAKLDSAEVLPWRPQAGSEINHRFIYSACDAGVKPITGTLVRKLVFNRRVLLEEKLTLTLQPGQWAVDVFVGIPAGAEAGWYGVEIQFEHPELPLYNWQHFQLVQR